MLVTYQNQSQQASMNRIQQHTATEQATWYCHLNINWEDTTPVIDHCKVFKGTLLLLALTWMFKRQIITAVRLTSPKCSNNQHLPGSTNLEILSHIFTWWNQYQTYQTMGFRLRVRRPAICLKEKQLRMVMISSC